MGTIYLIHFSKPYKHAKHYLGWTENLTKRIAKHRKGQGAKLLRVLKKEGIDFEVVRTWRGSRSDERKLKNRKEAPRLCPVCSKNKAKGM